MVYTPISVLIIMIIIIILWVEFLCLIHNIIKTAVRLKLYDGIAYAIFMYNMYQITNNTDNPQIPRSCIKQNVPLMQMLLFGHKSLIPKEIYVKLKPYMDN